MLTAAERRAALDARLEKSYGNFDGLIIAEHQRAGAVGGGGAGSKAVGSSSDGGQGTGEGVTIMASAKTGGVGGGVGGSSGGGIGGGSGSGGGTANGNGGSGTLPVGTAINHTGDYTGQTHPVYPSPPDIPTGNDDEVVAKQLREAALHEADPELREKMWNEYRKYTGLSK